LKVELNQTDSAGRKTRFFYKGTLVSAWQDKLIMKLDEERLESRGSTGILTSSLTRYSYETDSLAAAYHRYLNRKRTIHDSISVSKRNYYSGEEKKMPSESIRIIKSDRIAVITFPKRKGRKNEPMPEGTPLWIAGLSGALLFAPAASINYNTWEFNQKNYYNLLAFFGCVFVLGIPVDLLFDRERHCRIRGEAPFGVDKDYYHFQAN
jgi:hypothetical protein